MSRLNGVAVGLLVFIVVTGIAIATPRFSIEDAGGNTVAWINQSGTLNISEDFMCSKCINPEDVNDIDKANIETDLNTFVDIPGDTMVGPLGMENANITLNETYALVVSNDHKRFVTDNGSCILLIGATSEIHVC